MSSITNFADYLGFSQPMVSGWLNGRNKPSAKSLPRLAEKLGNGIYEALDLRPVDPKIILDWLSPDLQERFESARNETNAELAAKGISANSPEGEVIAKQKLSKYGL